MNRDFFEGYAERVDLEAVLGADPDQQSSSSGGKVLDMMFRGRVKNYVENRTLLIKEFELDLYKTGDGRYVIHICRLDGSSNYCDYYLVDKLHRPLKYRIARALLSESMEPEDIHFELGKHSGELQEVSALLSGVNSFRDMP